MSDAVFYGRRMRQKDTHRNTKIRGKKATNACRRGHLKVQKSPCDKAHIILETIEVYSYDPNLLTSTPAARWQNILVRLESKKNWL